MTGPEHYREAERLLAGHDFKIEGEPFHNPPSDRDIAAATARALLAQAAAFAMAQPVAGLADEQGLDQGDFDAWYAAVNGLPPETHKPVEEYPGELDHLRTLLSAVKHAAPADDPEADNPLTQILIDHYSDPRIVAHGIALADTAALDAAADAEFAADTEGQR